MADPTDVHAASTNRPSAEPHDAPPAPSHAERSRTLLARAKSAALSTVARDPAGFPYGSLVAIAGDDRGRPLLLLSSLAEHTGNLLANPQASILVTEAGVGEALALGRLTLLGPCRRVVDGEVEAVRAAYLAAQPSAARYVGFGDFAFYRLEPMALRYVGGFGRMSWVAIEAYAAAAPDPLHEAAAAILAHMNGDHGTANLDYARGLARIDDATAATMTAVDRYGFELAVETPGGPRLVRLGFDAPAASSDEVRRALVALVKRARAIGGSIGA